VGEEERPGGNGKIGSNFWGWYKREKGQKMLDLCTKAKESSRSTTQRYYEKRELSKVQYKRGGKKLPEKITARGVPGTPGTGQKKSWRGLSATLSRGWLGKGGGTRKKGNSRMGEKWGQGKKPKNIEIMGKLCEDVKEFSYRCSARGRTEENQGGERTRTYDGPRLDRGEQ